MLIAHPHHILCIYMNFLTFNFAPLQVPCLGTTPDPCNGSGFNFTFSKTSPFPLQRNEISAAGRQK